MKVIIIVLTIAKFFVTMIFHNVVVNRRYKKNSLSGGSLAVKIVCLGKDYS